MNQTCGSPGISFIRGNTTFARRRRLSGMKDYSNQRRSAPTRLGESNAIRSWRQRYLVAQEWSEG
jgi:hypothetical protein